MCGEHPPRRCLVSICHGIIPACAGSTGQSLRRSCGSRGSSPHVRGAQVADEAVSLEPGIIPACAGSTERAGRSGSVARDHPRMCGEHSGLSERAVPRPGIIPACAGSTNVDTSTCTYIGDHPRMCGEHSSRKAFLFASMGSSPHVRGARVHQRPPRSRTGIIPACAGST